MKEYENISVSEMLKRAKSLRNSLKRFEFKGDDCYQVNGLTHALTHFIEACHDEIASQHFILQTGGKQEPSK